jgi:YebC/PmpR family DNA-binding regulatory protein
MAGHSKWSKVKHIKGVLDVRRGKLFSKFSKEITVAARLGGGNPDFNPRLRTAVLTARSQSMPADNIERAIKKGTGELAADALEEMTYEGYGPDGVAFLVEAATDNKNRTAADLRTIFSRNGGNLAASGSVAYLFHRKGHLTVPQDAAEEEKILEILLEAGADELLTEEGFHRITTPPDALYAVSEALRAANLPIEEQKLTYQAELTKSITEEDTARRVLRLCDALEDCDDVLNIHSNFDLPDALWQRLQEV